MNEVLIPMAIGTVLGWVFGFLIGRDNPRKILLRIAYMDGRIDQGERKSADGKYE